MQGLILQLEQFIIKTKEYMVKAVAEMLEKELPVLTEEKFTLFQTTGNRLIYEQDYFAKRKFLTVFGVAAQWMKQAGMKELGKCSKEAVMRKLEEILYSICAEECWALPAHVNLAAAGWRNTLDLFAAETAQALCDIVEVLEADLSSQCVCLVKENVQRRVLQPFFEAESGSYGWEMCDNNWNAVCNGNIGSAYLHSLKRGQELDFRYLERICENLLHYISGFAEDGTCMEGLGYYFYGMTYWVNYAEELYQKTNGEKDLFRGDWGSFRTGEPDKRTQIAEWWSKCFFKSGRTVSFSDGDSREKYRMGLACALAERFENVHIPSIKQAMSPEEDPCYRYIPFKMDLFRTLHYMEKLRNEESNVKTALSDVLEDGLQGRSTILKDAQWCIAEAVMHKVGFACKGGHNAEPHNHNDVGSFLYVAGGDMFLTDLGAGEYTKGYFGEERYDILCNRSLGHSVPLIEGKEQLTGEVYGCKYFEAKEPEAKVEIIIDMTKAYEADHLKSFLRKLIFNKENGNLIIEDTFECDAEVKITENLVTQFVPETEGKSIILLGKSICHIQILSGQKEKQEVFRVVQTEHSNHQGQKEKVYLLQWDRIVKKHHKECFKIEMI